MGGVGGTDESREEAEGLMKTRGRGGRPPRGAGRRPPSRVYGVFLTRFPRVFLSSLPSLEPVSTEFFSSLPSFTGFPNHHPRRYRVLSAHVALFSSFYRVFLDISAFAFSST